MKSNECRKQELYYNITLRYAVLVYLYSFLCDSFLPCIYLQKKNLQSSLMMQKMTVLKRCTEISRQFRYTISIDMQ